MESIFATPEVCEWMVNVQMPLFVLHGDSSFVSTLRLNVTAPTTSVELM